jgi:hypothetical protein
MPRGEGNPINHANCKRPVLSVLVPTPAIPSLTMPSPEATASDAITARLGKGGTVSVLLDVAAVARLQLTDSVPRVLQELHLREVDPQRLGRGRNGGNRGVASLFGCFSRLFG